MTELRNCPFCGGEASESDFTEPFVNGWIGCQKCHCFINWVKRGKHLAVAAWNRRAEDAELQKYRQAEAENCEVCSHYNPRIETFHCKDCKHNYDSHFVPTFAKEGGGE